MNEKYTITITEKGVQAKIEKGDIFGILAGICNVIMNVLDSAPTGIRKKNLALVCCVAIMSGIDDEKEEESHESGGRIEKSPV